MKLETYREIVACLRGERVLYHYFPDRYAFMLLGWAAAEGVRVEQLRASPLAPLLQKPSVRSVIAQCGNGQVEQSSFSNHWPDQTRSFVLGLTHWAGLQTSQRGRYDHNLVLQINFTQEHLQEVIDRFGRTDLFNSYYHPVQSGEGARGRETLAWARIDLDFDTDEALIEEVQSDWMSTLNWAMRHGMYRQDQRLAPGLFRGYVRDSLGWLNKAWGEAMLAAAIDFIRTELGIRRVYFHTFEGGVLTKGMANCPPPRSVYTELPRKFCLQTTSGPPEFLQRDRRLKRLFRARRDIAFHQLVL